MECSDLLRDRLAAKGGALDAPRVEAVEKHLSTCKTCREAARRDDVWLDLVRQHLREAPAPEALQARVRAALEPPSAPWYGRALGSNWVPRLAMAAVLALLVLLPIAWFGRGAPALATGAAERHACHVIDAHGPLPPCCTALAVGPGDVLGEPSPGAHVPDLETRGLHFVRATRCTFGAGPVNMLAYTDAAGGRFSLYITSEGTREFKLLRHDAPHGVPQWRHAVDLAADANHPAMRSEVTMWRRGPQLWTWVGSGTAYDAALASLQQER